MAGRQDDTSGHGVLAYDTGYGRRRQDPILADQQLPHLSDTNSRGTTRPINLRYFRGTKKKKKRRRFRRRIKNRTYSVRGGDFNDNRDRLLAVEATVSADHQRASSQLGPDGRQNTLHEILGVMLLLEYFDRFSQAARSRFLTLVRSRRYPNRFEKHSRLRNDRQSSTT